MRVKAAAEVHVAVGVVTDAAGRVLISRRAADRHQGGLWEFPGGKVESGESVTEALRRELNEELGIRVLRTRPLIRVSHDYGDKRVLLDVHQVDEAAGEAHGREGQPVRWVPAEELPRYPFPAANRPILAAVVLPRRCLVTPEMDDERRFLETLERALQGGGSRFVQLRRHDLSTSDYRCMATRVIELCRARRVLVALNADPDTALELGADACHLTAARLRGANGVRPLPDYRILGASCHDAEELRRAVALGADYAFLSPVMATASHPEAKPLGWAGFQRLVEGVPLPVFALGGLGDRDLPDARAHGAHGVAGISAFWPDLGSPRETG